ncbi:YdcF family protein [Olivibacter jilunii]|uniref:YdcF family protein n=1 Tax=Olivibacter jilunii TaxID=985016 RepID=UPI003F170A3E
MSKRLFAGGFLWLFIITCSPIPNILIYGLESKYRTYSRSRNDKIDYILVLGGGFTENKTLPNFEQLSTASLSRISEAMRIKKIFPTAKLVMSGSKMNRTISQAEIYANTAVELGFDRRDIVLLREPKNTAEEAQLFYTKFGKGARFVLITDASHMQRAVYAFMKKDLFPTPAPTNHYIKEPKKLYYNFRPSFGKIKMMDVAIHEYLGLLFYKLKNVLYTYHLL